MVKKISLPLTALSRSCLEMIFFYLDEADLRRLCAVCWKCYSALSDENDDVWELCYRRAELDERLLKVLPSFKTKLRAMHHAWSQTDHSDNIHILADKITMLRSSVANHSDGVRGKVGVTSDKHCWEVWWESPIGSAACVGVSTRSQVMTARSYMQLIGSSEHSWGWNISDNCVMHAGRSNPYPINYPSDYPKVEYTPGERIRVILDCNKHTLEFEKDSQPLGIAFQDLPKTRLYATVSTVYGASRVRMVYLGDPSANDTGGSLPSSCD